MSCGFRFGARCGEAIIQRAPAVIAVRLELRALIRVVGAAQVLHAAATVLSEVTAVSPALAILATLTEAATLMSPTLAALTVAIASVAAPFAPVATIHSMLVLMRPQNARQHREAGLLGIVEALIKGRSGIGDLLERGARFAHGVGALAHPVERTGRRLRLGLLLRGLPRLHTLEPQLNHIPQSRFERRPILGLVRRKLEAGLQRCDARVGECGNVVGTEMTVLMFGAGTTVAETTTTVGTLLRVDKR
jgi:hypothetical protein